MFIMLNLLMLLKLQNLVKFNIKVKMKVKITATLVHTLIARSVPKSMQYIHIFMLIIYNTSI